MRREFGSDVGGRSDDVKDIEDFAAGFDEADDFAVDGYKDRSRRRGRKFNNDFVREGMTLAIDFRRHDFAAHTFLLPTGRE